MKFCKKNDNIQLSRYNNDNDVVINNNDFEANTK